MLVFHFYDLELMQFVIRFMRAAQLPDDLEMLLDEQRLGVSAAYTDTALGVCCIQCLFADARSSTSCVPLQLRQPAEVLF